MLETTLPAQSEVAAPPVAPAAQALAPPLPRPAQATVGTSPAWIECGATLAVWTVLLALHALALLRDAARSGQVAHAADVLVRLAPGAAAVALAGCALALVLRRHAGQLLRPARLAVAGCLFAIITLPMQAAGTAVAAWLYDGMRAPGPAARMLSLDAFGLWLNACMVLLAFAAHTGAAAWRRSRAQALAWEELRAEALVLRLRYLQGQLKPHFLFNALNSISALVRTAERELAARALEQLGDLLRHVLEASRHEWLSAASEIDFITAYADLQLLRFGERLTVDISVDAAGLRHVACPPLLLQPLVENAIHHGAERQAGACHVDVRLDIWDGRLRLVVRNPVGPGAPAAGHGLGLAATRERLALLFGPAASLSAGAADGYYIATLVFPLRRHHGTT